MNLDADSINAMELCEISWIFSYVLLSLLGKIRLLFFSMYKNIPGLLDRGKTVLLKFFFLVFLTFCLVNLDEDVDILGSNKRFYPSSSPRFNTKSCHQNLEHTSKGRHSFSTLIMPLDGNMHRANSIAPFTSCDT